MAFKVNHLHFKTPDPEATAQWYQGYLGATMVSTVGPAESPIGFRLDLHGVPLNVTKFVEGQELAQFYGLEHVALDTDDLPGLIANLKAAGNSLLEQRQTAVGRQICFLEGPEGVRFELIEMAQ